MLRNTKFKRTTPKLEKSEDMKHIQIHKTVSNWNYLFLTESELHNWCTGKDGPIVTITDWPLVNSTYRSRNAIHQAEKARIL